MKEPEAWQLNDGGNLVNAQSKIFSTQGAQPTNMVVSWQASHFYIGRRLSEVQR